MNSIPFGKEHSTSIKSYDKGSGQPVVFSHGWPLASDPWEDQVAFMGARESRFIAHGRSIQP